MKRDIKSEINSEKSALESEKNVDLDSSLDFEEPEFFLETETFTSGENTAETEAFAESKETAKDALVSGEANTAKTAGELPVATKFRKVLGCFIFALSLCLALCGGIYLRSNIFTPVQVAQTSMFDTLSDGDRLYINQLDKGGQFDIVVIYEPLVSQNWLIKRIIATGGQEIEIADGILYITENGVTTEYREEYVNGENITQEKIYVPEGYIYVLGDNRAVSIDSQDYGVISWDKVVGTAIFVKSEDAVVINSYPAQ